MVLLLDSYIQEEYIETKQLMPDTKELSFNMKLLIVDKDLSFASGKVMIETILEKVFGQKVNVYVCVKDSSHLLSQVMK